MAAWLFSCAALVFAMVLLGGYTRLTGSGLSMVDWRPVTGWLPPLDGRAWARLFDAYRGTPEFRGLNFWMTLEDFKGIFWPEYLHRLMGRVVGLAYALPLLWFAVRHRPPPGLAPRLWLLLLLGAAQGVLGWYMVRSGLVDRPSVSHYRLAAHLGLAVAIYALLLHAALGLVRPRARRPAPLGVRLLAGLAFATMIWGALLAGLDGGRIHNTFPLMDGRLLHPDAAALSPWWRNPVENPAAVQLLHRLLGTATALAALWLWLARRRRAPRALPAAALLALLQFGLGAAAILTGAELPVALAHQAGAMLLFTAVVWAWHDSSRTAAGPET